MTADEGIAALLAQLSPLEPREGPLLECLGDVLAEDVEATVAIPPFTTSAVDGYAVHAEDLHGQCELAVVGESRAGHSTEAIVKAGTAAFVTTGGLVPPGTASVVRREQIEFTDAASRIRTRGAVAVGANIRYAGEDVQPGSTVVQRGRLVGPAEIAVLAATGRASVAVIRRPLVEIVATGDELVEIGEPLTLGKTFNANSYALAAQAKRVGAQAHVQTIVRDSEADLQERLLNASEADLIVSTGGASSGPYDIVSRVVTREGREPLIVSMKPGRSVVIGALWNAERAKAVPYLGFPGGPVAAMVAFEVFARPAILRLRGIERLDGGTVQAITDDDLPNRLGHNEIVRVCVVADADGCHRVTRLDLRHTHSITSALAANGLATVPGGGVRRGEPVSVRLLDWPGG